MPSEPRRCELRSMNHYFTSRRNSLQCAMSAARIVAKVAVLGFYLAGVAGLALGAQTIIGA